MDAERFLAWLVFDLLTHAALHVSAMMESTRNNLVLTRDASCME